MARDESRSSRDRSTIFRTANDQIVHAVRTFVMPPPLVGLMRGCTGEDRDTMIRIAFADFEAAREHPGGSIRAPNHLCDPLQANLGQGPHHRVAEGNPGVDSEQ